MHYTCSCTSTTLFIGIALSSAFCKLNTQFEQESRRELLLSDSEYEPMESSSSVTDSEEEMVPSELLL